MSAPKPSTAIQRRRPPAASLAPAAGLARGPHPLALRRGQGLDLTRLAAGELLSLEAGCLLLRAATPEAVGRIALVLVPGDVLAREAVPPLPDLELVAATPASVRWRPRLAPPSQPEPGAPACSSDLAVARLAARSTLRALLVSELTAEQRLASYLLELALCFGVSTPGGCVVELPLSRTEMAGYLALNPDTLSRLLSRFRARRLLAVPARGRITITRLAALAALSPLAGALLSARPGTACGAAIGPAAGGGP